MQKDIKVFDKMPEAMSSEEIKIAAEKIVNEIDEDYLEEYYKALGYSEIEIEKEKVLFRTCKELSAVRNKPSFNYFSEINIEKIVADSMIFNQDMSMNESSESVSKDILHKQRYESISVKSTVESLKVA
jgi:hypothetical protein